MDLVLSDALVEARTHLPNWIVPSYALIHLGLAAVVPFALTWLGIRWALRGYKPVNDEPWVEKARLVFPARQVGATLPSVCMVGFASITLFYGWPFSTLARLLIGIAAGTLAFASGQLATRTLERFISEEPISILKSSKSLAAWLLAYNGASLILLQFPLVPHNINGIAIPWVVLLVVLYLWLSTGRGILLLTWIGWARPVDERLAGIVNRAAAECGHSPKAAYVIDCEIANAIAYPNLDILAFTHPIAEIMEDEELFAVCMHELGHLTESTGVIRMRVMQRFLLLPFLFLNPVFAVGNLTGLLILIAGVLFVSNWARRLSLKMELRADELSKKHEEQEGVYAQALEKLYRFNCVPAVMSAKQTHPEFYDRLIAAGVEPDYPRPAPPPARRFMIITLALCCPIAVVAVVLRNEAYRHPPQELTEQKIQWMAGISTTPYYDASLVEWLGYKAADRGDDPAYLAFLRAATALDKHAYSPPTRLAESLANKGHCKEARQYFDEAVQRWKRHYPSEPMPDSITYAAKAVVACN